MSESNVNDIVRHKYGRGAVPAEIRRRAVDRVHGGAPHVDGKFMSALVRVRKPARAR